MEFIAYNTTLDIKNLVKLNKDEKRFIERERELEFISNKKRLLPYVLKYLHYMVELHNSVVINRTYAGGDYRSNARVTGIRDNAEKLDLQEVLQKYTNDVYFKEDNGATYDCNTFGSIVGSRPKIWLHGAGKFVNNRNLEYSITGATDRYADSVEDYIKQLAKLWVNSERS